MAYFAVDYDTLTNGVVTGTETVYLTYADALSCNQGEAIVDGLNEDDTKAARARCSTVVFATPSGKTVQLRPCSGSSGAQIDVIGGNDGYVQDGTVPGGGGGNQTPANYDDEEIVGFVTT